MKFSNAQLDDFIALYREEFGVVLDRAEADRLAMALVALVKEVYRPMTQEAFNQVIAKMAKLK